MLGLETAEGWEKHREQSGDSSCAPEAAGEQSLLGKQQAWDGLIWLGLCVWEPSSKKPPQTRQKAKCSELLQTGCETYKVLLPLVPLLCLLQHLLCLLELGVHELLLQVLVFEHLLDVLPREHHQSLTRWACRGGRDPEGRPQSPEAPFPTSPCPETHPVGQSRLPQPTSSRSSYCSMSFLSRSASSMFSWRSLEFLSLCCSIWSWMSFSVTWKWEVTSFLFSSSSRARWTPSSCTSRAETAGPRQALRGQAGERTCPRRAARSPPSLPLLSVSQEPWATA